MTSGLHACKPGNEPVVGQVKTFAVQQMTSRNGKPYTKIKSANAENGGQPYKILKATPTGHTDSYGNISFNVEIEPANGAISQSSHGTPQRGNGDDRSSRIERQHSQEMAIRYCALKGIDAPSHEDLRKLIDWFQRDVGHIPSAPAKQEPESQPEPDDLDDEPPF